jgi:hypothetical protein
MSMMLSQMAQLLPTASAVDCEVNKKNLSVIHLKGFRFVLYACCYNLPPFFHSNFSLKHELLPVRAISDLSFGHPSEGMLQ